MPILIALGYDFDWFLNPKRSQNGRRIGSRFSMSCKLPNVLKCKKTNGFSMILVVRVFDCWDEKWTKIDKKTKSKPDLHVWLIFDWFFVDFGPVLGFKNDQTSLKKQSGKQCEKTSDQNSQGSPYKKKQASRHHRFWARGRGRGRGKPLPRGVVGKNYLPLNHPAPRAGGI